MSYSCVFKILRIKQVLSWWWCCASHISPIAVGSRSNAYKPSFSIFAKRCPHLFPIYKQLLVSHNQPYLLPTTSRRPWKNLARWPLPALSAPQSWCSVQCTGIYAREIMSNRASCKHASSTIMMIVTADGEANYGMPDTAPILRCHLRRRVLSLHCEKQHVIIWPTGSTVLLHW